jgi:pantoate--beta-alanine ligase
MQIFNTIPALREATRPLRAGGRPLALVPTMGALHAGHLSLVRAARAAVQAEGGAVAVSIFVNPAQFGPNEDFSRYPRTLEADCRLLEAEGVDFVFAPSAAEMYPGGAPGTTIHVSGISERLDGASRPGHFDGVATVVAKLFHIIEPQRAFFGQKDAAQVAVLRAMVRDLNFPVELIVCPTVREADGLALSSRNRYLSAAEREQALALSRSLRLVYAMHADGETGPAALMAAARDRLTAQPLVRVDYIEAVDPLTLLPVETAGPGTLFAMAAWVGATRLIDNVLLGQADSAP